jgi:hypothetical protein
MKVRSFVAVVLFAAALLVTGCSGTSGPAAPEFSDVPEDSRVVQWTFGDDLVLTLWAGQTIDVGTLTVSNDFDYIYFTYATTGDWYLTETHLHVGESFDDIPTNGPGNPQPGHFNNATDHDPPVQTFTYAIDMGDWDAYDYLVFAAHAVVDSETMGNETAWAGCYDFLGKRWGQWCDYYIQRCVVHLPDVYVEACDVGAYFHYPGTTSYWDITLSGIPNSGEYDVYDGTWPGWCIQQFVYLYNNTNHLACLIDSYGDDIPEAYDGIEWDKVTYIINHKAGNKFEVQEAIWHFTLDGLDASSPNAVAMVEAANLYGEGYVPGAGELTPVFVYVDPNVQSTFIEVEIGCI